MNHISINSKIYKEEEAKISVLDNSLLMGDGIFTSLRTYNGKLFLFSEHCARLKENSQKIDLPFKISENKLKTNVEKLIQKNKLKNARIRITLTRGIGNPWETKNCQNQSIIITADKITKEKPGKPIKAITYQINRNLPEIKSISYLPCALAKREAIKQKAFEAILLDGNGFVREGAASNVFIVKNNYLITPKDKILKGVTRDLIIKIARKNKIKIKEANFRKEILFKADEIFIANSIQGILPVVKINKTNKKIKNITKKLIDLYGEYTKNYQ